MKYEIKKLLLRKEVLIVFLLSLAAIILFSLREPWRSFETMKASRKFTAEYYDISLDEACERIDAELEKLNSESSENNAKRYVLNDMKRSANDYHEHEKKLLERVKKMYADLDNAATDFEQRDLKKAIKLYNRKLTYRILNSSELNYALLNSEYDLAMKYMYLLMLCTLLAPLFSVESETGMYQLLYSSQKGKRGLFRKKISAALICTTAFALLYTAMIFFIVWLKYGLSFRVLFAPIQCAEIYRNCPFKMSVFSFIAANALMRMIVGFVYVSLTALISCPVQKNAAVFSVTSGITGVLIFISVMLSDLPDAVLFMKLFGILSLMAPSEYFSRYETVNVLGFPIYRIILSAACTFFSAILMLSAAYLVYTAPKKVTRRKVN